MAKAQKSPAYQWYPKDYRTDAAVIAMSLEAEGAYRNLMDVEWLEVGVPNDPEMLWRFARCTSRDHFEQLWPSMRDKFVERDGRLYHPRLDEERKKQRKNSKARKLAAQKRWMQMQSKSNTSTDANGCLSSSSSIATPVVPTRELTLTPPVAAPPPPPTDNRTTDKLPVRRVFEHHQRAFAAKVGAPPAYQHGKDAGIVARLLRKRGEADVLGLVDELFLTNDPFIAQSGYTFGVLESCLNKLIASRQKRLKVVEQRPSCRYNHKPPCKDDAACLQRWRDEQLREVS